MEIAKVFGLFVVTAIAEIVGCYLPYLWLKQGGSAWLLIPVAFSLALFAWLLTLHPSAAGRIYAAYGGVYIGVAIMWLWLVESIKSTTTDWVGVQVCFSGVAIIVLGSKHAYPIRQADWPTAIRLPCSLGLRQPEYATCLPTKTSQ